MVEFDNAIRTVKTWLEIWKDYNEMPNVFMLKYEDLIHNQNKTVKSVEDFLEIHVNDRQRKKILWKYSRDNAEGERTGMHFNVAKTNRFRSELSEEQKAKCIVAFKEYLDQMTYSAD